MVSRSIPLRLLSLLPFNPLHARDVAQSIEQLVARHLAAGPQLDETSAGILTVLIALLQEARAAITDSAARPWPCAHALCWIRHDGATGERHPHTVYSLIAAIALSATMVMVESMMLIILMKMRPMALMKTLIVRIIIGRWENPHRW